LKGIGPKTAEVLKKTGIKTVRDFFYNLPRDYENFAAPTSISAMRPGKVVIRGKIDSLSNRPSRRRHLSITEGVVSDGSGSVRVVWFNQSYRMRQFDPEKEYYFSGVYELKNNRYQITSPSAILVSDVDVGSGLAPIYVAHGSVKSNDFKRLMNNSRERFSEIPDLLPTVAAGTRKEALYKVHFPESVAEATSGRNYLAYEELFELILAARLNREENEKLRSENEKLKEDLRLQESLYKFECEQNHSLTARVEAIKRVLEI
jgi:ATP-dependent DNA helicase RecG